MSVLGLGALGGGTTGAGTTGAVVGSTGAEGASVAVPVAGSGASAAGSGVGSSLLGSLSAVGGSLLEGLNNIGLSLKGPTGNFVGPPGGTPFQNILGGLSEGATQGFYGQHVPGSIANYLSQGLGEALQRKAASPGQQQEAPPAQVLPLRRYMGY